MSTLREIFILLQWSLPIFIIGYSLLLGRAYLINKEIKVSFLTLGFKFFLRLGILTLLTIAWMGPHISEPGEKVNLSTESRDIIVALDLSHSMLSDDLKPSRIDRAKIALKKIAQKMEGNNFGLIVFSNSSFTSCPITFDSEYFSKMLDFANPKMIANQGTDLQPALEMCLDRLVHRDQISSNSKAILLVSDGEDFGEEMSEITNKIKKEGIKTFCIGIGTTKGGTIKIDNEYKRDRQRNIVRTSLNRKPLKKLAQMTNGKYYEISNSQNDLTPIINDLESIKAIQKLSNVKKAPKTTFYHYFLFIALFLLIIDFFIKPKLIKL